MRLWDAIGLAALNLRKSPGKTLLTVLGLGVNALLLVPAVLFFPLSLPYVLLFPCGLSGFASGMIGWSSCKRYLIR